MGNKPKRLTRAAVAACVAVGMSATGAASAGAAEIIYDNFNTVPTTVNGMPNEDTYSQSYGGGGVTGAGNVVKFVGSDRTLTSVTTEVDSFKCEKGEYQYENCYSKPNKKFSYPLTLRVYDIEGGYSRGRLEGEVTEDFKVPYRPTTNVHCPATPEGKGFGSNCDVGGVLGKITFKKLSSIGVLGEALLEIRNPTPEAPVNLGLEEAYKGFSNNEFEGVPGSYTPSVGTDPLGPETLFLSCEDPPSPFCNAPAEGELATGYGGSLPVFLVKAH